MPAIHDSAAVLANARRLGQMARLLGVPVWATEQNPAKLGGTDEALAALCDRIVPKMAFSGADELQPLLAPPSAGHSSACCWRSSACACARLAAAAFRFWLFSSTRCTSACSTGSSHNSHHCPCDQARASLALTQPAAGAAFFQCIGTGIGSIGV